MEQQVNISSNAQSTHNKTSTTLRVLLWLAMLVGLFVASRYNFILFHILAELISIVIAAGVFIVAWNTRRVIQSNYLLLLGIAFLFIGAIDLLHALSYKGMAVFEGYGANLPTQLWISARYMESISLLLAVMFIDRAFKLGTILSLYAAVTVALVVLIFSGAFPDCFIDGSGLTPFKKTSEYVISLIIAGSMVLLYRRRKKFQRGVYMYLMAAMAAAIVSELAFTFYVSVYGLSNLVGHYLKLLSFYLIYKALVETGLRKPYELLYRDMALSKQKYQSLFSQMLDGFAYHRIVADEHGKPVDYVFLEVNDAFERLTGLDKNNLIGKRVTEALPGIEKDPFDWIGKYGTVALDGKALRFEQYSSPLDKWYSVMAYSPERGYFAAVFEDITARKNVEEQLRNYSEELTKYSRALEQNNVDLQNLVSEKEMLMKEIHHRVKNNFLIVYSLLRFQSLHVKDSESKEMFKESQDRVRAMSLLHEKLYKSYDMENVDFADFIQSIAQQLVSSYQVAPNSVSLSIDVPKVVLDVDIMVPCGLIVNELITNSLKHAFPGDTCGRIHISGIMNADGRFTLSVKDAGVGLPEGFTVKGTKTLGLELVDMLVSQLEGTLEIINHNGAEFRIGFDTQRFIDFGQD